MARGDEPVSPAHGPGAESEYLAVPAIAIATAALYMDINTSTLLNLLSVEYVKTLEEKFLK